MTTPTADRQGILVIDLGTSGARAALYDHAARRVAGVGVDSDWELHVTADGGAELDATQVIELSTQVIDQALAQCRAAGWTVRAVASCVLCPTLVGLDEGGRALTPIYTWADVRAAAAAAELRDRLDPEAVHQRTGCVLHAAYLPAKLRRLAQADPARFAQCRYWGGIGDYLTLQLTGQWRTSLSVASWTGLMNRHRLEWDEELLAAAGAGGGQMPQLDPAETPVAGLQDEWGRRWSELADVPWFLPVGDGAASNLGSGCTGPERVALMVATSGAVRVILTDAVERIPNGLWCYRVDNRRLLLGGALSSAGNVIDWLVDFLQAGRLDKVSAELSRREPDAHGLIVLPFMAGERNPNWADRARGAVVGVSLKTQPIDVLQASLEAVAYQFALVYERLRPLLPADHQVIASGGVISHNPIVTQLLSDVLGRAVTVCDEGEISSRGVSLLTLERLGLVSDATQLGPALGRQFTPREGLRAAYERGLERHQALYARLISQPAGS